MASLNRASLIGNVGRDPEVRYSSSNAKIVNLQVATTEKWKDKATGEQREKTEWHRVVIFDEGLADVAERYLTKGSKLFIEGAIQTRKWTDQAGVEKYSTEIVLAGGRGRIVLLGNPDRGKGDGDDYGRARPAPARRAPATTQRADLDDDIPF